MASYWTRQSDKLEQMNAQPARCLILACGNTLREDDGIGPFLASWAEALFADKPEVRVIASHQWTPELAADVAEATTVLFIDCSVNAAPGSVAVTRILAGDEMPRLMTHHLDATSLLALARAYYERVPHSALLLTVGAGSLQLREGFSEVVTSALPEAKHQLESSVRELLNATDHRR
jgi:hydrogenase maturation protease